jgi:DNA helicase-2/ATP-dependent DNA helicase PcrA
MQPEVDGCHFEQFIGLLCNYCHGKGGDTPTKKDLAEAGSIRKAYSEWLARKRRGADSKKGSILLAIRTVYEAARALGLTGDPDKDWRAIRDTLEKGACNRLRNVAEEVRNVRLLQRGTQLRQELAEDWRENGAYANALAITRQAFVREHFATTSKPEAGVVVMNMHKAKGKQFDEVIVFEGWPRVVKGRIVGNPDRIVRSNIAAHSNGQPRQNLRVSVTRARQRTTLLTPRNDPCVLLLPLLRRI